MGLHRSAVMSLMSALAEKEKAILRELDGDGDGIVSDDELRAYLSRQEGAGPGTAKVRVQGVVLHKSDVSKPYTGINGDYVRSGDVCNGRAIYGKEHTHGTVMWWANINGAMNWCVGPRSSSTQENSREIWASVVCLGPSPDYAGTRPWSVYSYKSLAWEMQSSVEVTGCDEVDTPTPIDLRPPSQPDGTLLHDPDLASTAPVVVASASAEHASLAADSAPSQRPVAEASLEFQAREREYAAMQERAIILGTDMSRMEPPDDPRRAGQGERLFRSERTFAAGPRVVSANRLFTSERKHSSPGSPSARQHSECSLLPHSISPGTQSTLQELDVPETVSAAPAEQSVVDDLERVRGKAKVAGSTTAGSMRARRPETAVPTAVDVSSPGSSKSSTPNPMRVVTMPPGRIRSSPSTDSRLRAPVSSLLDRAHFVDLSPPMHLTSPSRQTRPRSPPNDIPPASEPTTSFQASGRDPSQNELTRNALKKLVLMGTTDKAELRAVLDEGLELLSTIPGSLSAEMCATAKVHITGESSTTISRADRDPVQEGELCFDRLAKLVTRATSPQILQEQAPLTSTLLKQLLKVACRGDSGIKLVRAQLEKELKQWITEGRDLLVKLDGPHARTVLDTIVANKPSHPIARHLSSVLVEDSEQAVPSASGRKAVDWLVSQGEEILERIQGDQAAQILQIIRSAGRAAPLAADLCQWLMDEGGGDGIDRRTLHQAMLQLGADDKQPCSSPARYLHGRMFQANRKFRVSRKFWATSTQKFGPAPRLGGGDGRPEAHRKEYRNAVAAVVATAIAVGAVRREDNCSVLSRLNESGARMLAGKQGASISPYAFSQSPINELEISSIEHMQPLSAVVTPTMTPLPTKTRSTRAGLKQETKECAKALDIETLMQGLDQISLVPIKQEASKQQQSNAALQGGISLARQRQKHGIGESFRRLQAGVTFARQQATLQMDTAKLRDDLAALKCIEEDAKVYGSRAWKFRDRDISAAPDISSTTKIRAKAARVESERSFVMLEPDADITHSNFLQSESTRSSQSKDPASRPTMKRPSTSSVMIRPDSSQENRPKTSNSLPALALQEASTSGRTPNLTNISNDHWLDQTITPERSRGLVSLRNSPLMWANVAGVKRERAQYVHPTIFKLMTYQKRDQEAQDTLIRETQNKSRVNRPEASMRQGEYSSEHATAAVHIQRIARGLSARLVYKNRRKEMDWFKALMAVSKLQQSQRNTQLNKIRECDPVGEALAAECESTVSSIEAVFQQEKKVADDADKRSQKEWEELANAERKAQRELEEADEAEMGMEKERSEMLAWKIKVDRARHSYEDSKRELHIEDDEDEDEEWLSVNFPQALKEKRYFQSITSRYVRAKEEYEKARLKLAKERFESSEALEHSHKEKLEWQHARESALRERAQLDAIVMARKFTDPSVSVKERLRAWSGGSADAPCFLTSTVFGKSGAEHCVGQIFVNWDSGYAGEWQVVEEVPQQQRESAFEKHALSENGVRTGIPDHDRYLDQTGLQNAMRDVGRHINTEEASRLTRSFDADGNGLVEISEFEHGLNNMVGMELPHGLGREWFKNGGQYAGAYYQDKRHGIGMYITPSHYFYLGHWKVGVRHGKGIEGRFSSKARETMLPAAISTYAHGTRKHVDRFDLQRRDNLALFRSWLAICDLARKRSVKASRRVAGHVHRHIQRAEHKNDKAIQKMSDAIEVLLPGENQVAKNFEPMGWSMSSLGSMYSAGGQFLDEGLSLIPMS